MKNEIKQLEEALKPCPFCGSNPLFKEWVIGGHKQIKIYCDGEFCHIHPSIFGNKKAMVEQWSARAYDKDALIEKLESLKMEWLGDQYPLPVYDRGDLYIKGITAAQELLKEMK